jgi:hypothetical protein
LGGNAPLISVVTCGRNASRFVREAVDSILVQTVEDFEYILVDDASTDDTAEIMESYARSDQRVRLIRRPERGGPYVAANQGIREARGRFVARLDADDVSLPHRLERQLAFMASNPDLRACASDVKLLADGQIRDFDVGDLPRLPGSLKWRLAVRWGFMPSTTLIEKSAFDELGGFRELALSQDHEMWCRLARRRWLGVVPDVLAYWRVHSQQLSVTDQPKQERLGLEAIRDHLQELDEQPWTLEDVQILRKTGEWPTYFRTGLQLISRFEALWRADAELTDEERHELAALTRRIRFGHVRKSVPYQIRQRLRPSAT